MGIVVIAMLFGSIAWAISSVQQNVEIRHQTAVEQERLLRQQVLIGEYNLKCLRLRQQGIECTLM
jgi:hypothetical protein